ncbi:MAG TPA: BMP family ABC transporter substrate-binding protein [Micromonosporaceae bacterium]
MRVIALLAAGGITLAAAACGEAPDTGTPGATPTGKKYVACMVTDQGGLDDKSFNASAWKGMEAAKAQNPNIDIKNTASSQPADYEPNLTAFVNQKCDFILAVGGLMAEATAKIASANPNQQFAIVDAKLDNQNVYPMQFNTAEAGFLAGYLAAGYSKTGKVGTYGGLKIPPVTIFMDGFADGVAHYNKIKSKNVQVLGWNKATQQGLFANDFASPPKGKQQSDTLKAQGADVIMPVAGGTGTGTTADAAAGMFSAIWVDVDGCESIPQDCKGLLTTVVKNIPDAVRDAVLKGANKESLAPSNGFIGTLKNNGVSIAPYHDFDSKIDAALKAEIEKLKQDIIAGTVKVESPASPK